MATVYSGYSKGWKPKGSDIYKKYRARLDYSVSAETPTTITYKAILYVNINSSVNAPYTGTLNLAGSTYTGSCETVFGEGNTVTCVSAKTKTFNKGATATTAKISGGVRSSKGDWTGATVTASATVSIPALAPATITFNANGGSGSVSAISTYVGVANTIPSNSLTRTGYTFNGWNTASDGSGTAYATGSTITPTGDVTLYAQWKTTFVKPEIQNLVAFRTANDSGGASPTVTSTGKTGFCKFNLVGGANYTVSSVSVQFGTAAAKSMKKSGSSYYGYSTPDSIAQASAYTVKVTVVVTGTDGVSRTYTDSTYISKSVPVFDAANDGNCFAFFGTATDGLTSPKLIINGELALGTALSIANGGTGATTAGAARTNLNVPSIDKIKAMLCTAYPETLTVKNGTFTDDGCNASLVGNSLYLYIAAKAKAAITAGNITNQTMLTINFTDNRILTLYSVSGSGGIAGPNSQMQFKGASSGGQHTITVTLAAIAQNIAKGGVINAHASIPCVLNWDAY